MQLVLKFVFGISAFCFGWGCSGEKGEQWILACGEDRVLMIDPAASEGEKAHIVWQWQVSDCASQIPEIFLRQLPSVDECKPVEGNRKILITGGAAVVMLERETKKCLFYAHTPNSHSAELLPNNRIAVALSIAEGGNSLRLYDADKSDRILFKDSLYSGHGVVWIPERERLYALGFDELREYSLKNWDTESPALQLERMWRLPEDDGHDLSRVSKDRLLVTTARDVYRFDLVQERFTPFEPLQGVAEVKSVNCHETTGQLVYTKAEESWWTHHIYQKQPDRTLTLPDIRLYKARLMK
ncbi:MAG: SMP-30/gluconolactonase/LRE family protein [Tannerella sp.]|jgi:hypothetical protein|nr:SMP-30/gluconolactonase/LRE family protein [Tannerella sp.]